MVLVTGAIIYRAIDDHRLLVIGHQAHSRTWTNLSRFRIFRHRPSPTTPDRPLWRGQSAAAEHWSRMSGGGRPRTEGATMSKATDDPTESGASVHIDAVLIEAERQAFLGLSANMSII